MLHLFCKVNPPTYISTRDRPRYWPGAGDLETGRPGTENILKVLKSYWPGAGDLETGRPGLDKHSQKLLARGR